LKSIQSNNFPTTLQVEFHCHTNYSRDSLTSLESLLKACQRKKVDRLVITDHNNLQGALRAKQVDPERVILGEEIMTQRGEILAIFIKEEVPAGLTPMQTIAILQEQGAFICIAHPFDRLRKGHWQPDILHEIIPYIDAIEVFNARCMFPGDNSRAKVFAHENGLLAIVGSDAHITYELGKARMILPAFHDAESLRDSLNKGEIRVSLSPAWVHLFSRYAKWRKRIRLK
jgi:predicted metal-dependent phosphoesterase TrpH